VAGISEEETVNKKALVLLSGGLDSTLAARLMQEQALELEAINFLTCFSARTKKGCRNGARKASEILGIKLKIMNVTREYLEVVKNPRHGYGRNMNPCIDCRIFTFKKAKDYMEEIGASFVVTGEVLGERPMSQRPDAIRIIEKESGLKGLIVRPLSARLLKPSLPEETGIVDRNRLLDIQGRSRKPQIELAKELNITDYPCPAGGCLLTEAGFAKKIKDLIAHDAFTAENAHLLNVGRHFRLAPKAKLVVGRDKTENSRLSNLAMAGDILLDAKEIPGPIALLRTEGATDGLIRSASSIVLRYSDGNGRENAVLCWRYLQDACSEVRVSPATETTLGNMRI
jgi:tRNA-specific 2-thiouridylase